MRTLQPGRTFTLTDIPLDAMGAGIHGSGADADRTRFLVTRVVHAGINNLPKELGSAIASERSGAALLPLLRYADTQMMAAANNAFGPSQRAVFFHDIEAWFTVDYRGVLDNLADSGSHLQDDHVAGQPIVFDAEQTSRLLRAVAIPVLASQLRNLESLFGVALTHAEQSAFAARCFADAGAATDNDAELVSLAVQCWRREAPQPGATR